MNDCDLYWLAGLFEGEGCFTIGYDSRRGRVRRSPRIQLRMTDEDVVARVAALLECSYHRATPPSQRGQKPIYALALTDRRAVLLMRQLHPLLGARRRQRIAEILADQDPTGDRYGVAA